MPSLLEVYGYAVLAPLDATSLGAVYWLTAESWLQEPACTLPSAEESVRMLARVPFDAWPLARPRIAPLLAAHPDDALGRIVIPAAQAAFERLVQQAARRSAAGRSGRLAQLTGHETARTSPDGAPSGGGPQHPWRFVRPEDPPGESPANRRATASESPAARRSAPSLSSGFAPAPPRLQTLSADQESAPALRDESVGAGARAQTLLTGLERQADQAEVRGILARVSFPWANDDRRRVPRTVADDIASAPWVTPVLVAYVLETIHADGQHAAAAGKTINPLGMLINRTGCNKSRPGKPLEVPLVFHEQWRLRREAIARIKGLQDRVNQVASEGWKANPAAAPSSYVRSSLNHAGGGA